MNDYDLINFDVFDYKNENTLSSYALEQTPLTFIPRLSSYDYVRVLWDFGDGTYSTGLSSSKYYTQEGLYDTTLTIYDCYSNAIISTVIKTILIKNFLNHTFKIDFDDANYYDTIVWKTGKINGPLKVTVTVPPYQEFSDIFYRVVGSDSEYYYDNEGYKFRHLDKTYSFFKKIYNNFTENFQFDEVDRFSFEPLSTYAKIDGSNISICNPSDGGAFFVGLSAFNDFYFKDDSINKIRIDLFFDKERAALESLNLLKISLSADIIENDEISKLSITSNGMDGEFYTVDSFNIDNNKFSNVKIPFVIKIKDTESFSVKNFPPLSTNQINLIVISDGDILDPSYYTISYVDSFYGSSRSSIIFNNTDKINHVQLSASITTISEEGSSYSINGITNTFNVLPQNFLQIVKKNENIDPSEIFKELRFQEFLIDKHILFDDFMGSIFGTLSSNYDTLGKKIYEKTLNFVENIQDVDRSEVFSLISQMNMIGLKDDIFNSGLFTFPEKIKRLIDIGSISKNKLLGVSNKFAENFNTKGYVSKEIFGKNLGDEIDTNAYTISAGVPIVALEKFSNTYVLLNTQQPVESLSATTYKLSSYNLNWGWPLVLPDIFTFEDFDKYYIFFEYNPVYDGKLTDFSIFFNPNIYTSLSSENVLLTENNEIIYNENNQPLFIEFEYNYVNYLLDILYRDTFYQSLSLVHSN